MTKIKKIEKTGIGVVGLPGSGKSIVAEVAKAYSIPTVIMGDIIRQLCIDNELESNSENIGTIMVNIRKEEGMNAVAKRTLPKIAEVKENVVVIDGLRSYEEVELFRENLKKCIILAIHASPRTRYMRINERGRLDDTKNLKAFQDRDEREIRAGIAKIIALADIMFVNEGKIKPLKKSIGNVIHLIKEDKWR